MRMNIRLATSWYIKQEMKWESERKTHLLENPLRTGWKMAQKHISRTHHSPYECECTLDSYCWRLMLAW